MKIYIDVSETVTNQLNTGIQRVVREVVSYSEITGKKLGLETIPVVSYGKHFYQLKNLDPLLSFLPTGVQRIDVCQPKSSRTFRLAKRILKLLPFAYASAIKLKSAIIRKDQLDSICSKEPINVNSEDVLLLLDSFWSSGLVLKPTNEFRRLGGKVLTVVYDITPITHSEYYEDMLVYQFINILPPVLNASNSIIAISKAVMDELENFAIISNDKIVFPKLPIDYFHLGADFSCGAGLNDVPQDDLPKGLWDESIVFMMVGTLMPRKGHAFVLDVFEQRWQQGKTEKLLIIGKVGWKTEELVERIINSPYYGTQLHMMNQVSDSALSEAYEKAYACVVASYAEGFGLPVIESLQYRVPVIASDIPVFREIAGDYAEFFTLDDKESFNHSIESLQENYKTTKEKLVGFKWLTWQASTEQLLSKVKEMVLKLHEKVPKTD